MLEKNRQKLSSRTIVTYQMLRAETLMWTNIGYSELNVKV